MTYDAENRQTSLTDGGITHYYYDGEGRRVQKVAAGQPTTYVYDARGELAAEYGPVNSPPPCSTCYVTVDHLGSTRLLTNGQGAVASRYDYTPFGEEVNASFGQRPSIPGYVMSDAVQPKFTGQVRDYESGLGLDYFGARYFSSAQGRFTSDDPLNIPALQRLNPKQLASIIANPQNWNGYAYAHNNPLKNIDPDGYLTIIVPGTFNNHDEWEKRGFRKQVEATFGEKVLVLPNNKMGNSTEARAAAPTARIRHCGTHVCAWREVEHRCSQPRW